MKIFALSIVKNEADVIEETLRAACKWAHKIMVLDNGSTDGTWEIVQSLANDQITPFGQDTRPFRDGLRAQMYHALKHEASPGDWWCFRLDADEIYEDDPRAFLATIRPWYHYVMCYNVGFFLTPEDVEEYDLRAARPGSTEVMRYHDLNAWQEARFFRHRPGMSWSIKRDTPKHMGVLAPQRIKIRHYQYRSLEQIERRVQTRLAARAKGFTGFDYSANEEVSSYLRPRASLRYHEPGQPLIVDGPINPVRQSIPAIVWRTLAHATGYYK